MQVMIEDVEVMYPRLDQPYTWSNEKGSSVPCEWDAENAAFTVTLVVPYAKAVPLRKSMAAAYAEKKEDSWPKFQDKFTLVEGTLADKDAVFHVKTKLKAYDKNTYVRQFDVDNNKLPADFQLTRGSTVSVQVTLVPYSIQDNGTSLRLNAVQVIKLEPMQQSASPFAAREGYKFEGASPFGVTAEAPVKQESDGGDDWDAEPTEVPPEEPKKVVSKKKATPEIKIDIDDDLDSIIDDRAQ